LIVLADDKAENLQAIMETFEGSGTAVHAWRYSREDANVAALDTQQAAAQWDAAEPALMTIEEVFGPDNFDLPEPMVREGCEAANP
jgi:CheY-like chemotaxis protein